MTCINSCCLQAIILAFNSISNTTHSLPYKFNKENHIAGTDKVYIDQKKTMIACRKKKLKVIQKYIRQYIEYVYRFTLN